MAVADGEQDGIALSPTAAVHSRCLALSPHSDDVAFSLGAALLDGRFCDLTVVTGFSVSSCTDEDSGMGTARVTELRKQEDKAFFGTMRKRPQTIYLDRLDAPLRLNIPEEDVCKMVSGRADGVEVEQLADCLVRTMQEKVVLMAPLGLGSHVDHLIAHRAACLMMRYGYAVAFYEDLPYAAEMPLSAIKSTVDKVARSSSTALTPILIRSKADSSVKAAAVKAYQSQTDTRTITRIITHGLRLGGDIIVERLWCNGKALQLIQDNLSAKAML